MKNPYIMIKDDFFNKKCYLKQCFINFINYKVSLKYIVYLKGICTAGICFFSFYWKARVQNHLLNENLFLLIKKIFSKITVLLSEYL